MNNPIWSPSEQTVKSSRLFDFMRYVEKRTGQAYEDYDAIWRWSVDEVEVFWDALWDFCGVVGEKGARILVDGDQMPGAQFFPDATLNYAENLLQKRDDEPALISRWENGEASPITYKELYDQVSRWRQALQAEGIQKGDRVAGYMPNISETIVAALATVSLGAIWSSASPDFGVQGVVDRFGQIEPKVLISVDGYFYNGKEIDCLEKIRQIQPQIRGLKHTIIVPFLSEKPDLGDMEDTLSCQDFIQSYEPQEIIFEPVSFNHPLFIMFSSGTTGVPKCIVHGHGGTLLQHLKEHQLHCDIRPGDPLFYFTTCGWMMWNWLVTALASNATLLLYDGNPFYPDGNILWDYTSSHDCTFFGTSAKYIEAMKGAGITPKDTHSLTSLRTIASTGSPLVHASFDYVYGSIKEDVHLASISGGTDIVSCFVLGNPISPVYRGEIQAPGLGMAMDILDDEKNSLIAQAGELVCKRPFPCMPVAFWNDPDGTRYHGAYFNHFENMWVHGDWVERTSNGGFIMLGRSDATLNPGGVRIGTAEIYRQVEKIPAVMDCVAVGQDWDGDVRVILFVVLQSGWALDHNLVMEIKTEIRKGASPRHVPAKVIVVDDIPRTKSGKITEIAVRDVIMGRPIKNVEALANPKSLDLYRDLEALKA